MTMWLVKRTVDGARYSRRDRQSVYIFDICMGFQSSRSEPPKTLPEEWASKLWCVHVINWKRELQASSIKSSLKFLYSWSQVRRDLIAIAMHLIKFIVLLHDLSCFKAICTIMHNYLFLRTPMCSYMCMQFDIMWYCSCMQCTIITSMHVYTACLCCTVLPATGDC